MNIEYYKVPDDHIARFITDDDRIINVHEFYVPCNKSVEQTIEDHIAIIKEKHTPINKVLVTYRGKSLEEAVILSVMGTSEKLKVRIHERIKPA